VPFVVREPAGLEVWTSQTKIAALLDWHYNRGGWNIGTLSVAATVLLRLSSSTAIRQFIFHDNRIPG
jgi:hypothetical protein